MRGHLAAALLIACAACSGAVEAPESATGSAYWRETGGGRLVVDVVGHDFAWRYRFPGADGTIGTSDDVEARGDLHLPVRTTVDLRLSSEDYVYTFALPDLGQHEVAVPDMIFTISFTTGAPAVLDLLGDQMCGYQHDDLMGKLVIESDGDFLEWIGDQRQGHRAVRNRP